MKERPILFSGAMVRAILNGRKTMTRRVIKPQPPNSHWECMVKDYSLTVHTPDPGYVRFQHNIDRNREWATPMIVCPYGTVGDRLWVRETFAGDDWHGYVYRATEPDALPCGDEIIFKKWKPSIFMPREASRILLEIIDIRVERLNDISESDAENEGIGFLREIPDCDETMSSRELFEVLWESINGSGSWEKNPWVWVICFKRVER
ncbi:MAG TPA: hypothetical protein PKL77_10925 [Candidatus Omnitrophota bacterium]|nr:hypothetical protein [Candidatus Omnitrophota bacterium]